MIKRVYKRVLAVVLTVIFMAAAAPLAMAASSGISVNKSSVTVGQSVTASVSFSGGGTMLAGVVFDVYYDASVLRFASSSNEAGGGNGALKITIYDVAGKSSFAGSVTFTAIAAGTSTISISVSECMDVNLSPVACSGSSTSVTVSAGTGGQTSRPQSSTSASQSGSASEPEAEPITVTAQGKTMHLLRSLAGVELPDEFENAEDEIQGEIVDVARGINQDTLLVYLTETDGTGGGFYVFNRGSGEFYPFVRIVVNTTRYTVVSRPDSVNPPEGWSECEIEYGSQKISAFKSEDKAYDGYYLVYAADAEGKSDFFLFDFEFGTMQRFVSPTPVSIETQGEDEPEDATPSGNVIDRILADRQILVIVLSLAALSIVMVVAYLIFKLVKRCSKPSEKKLRKREDKVSRQLKKREAKRAGKVEKVKPEISSFDEATVAAEPAAAEPTAAEPTAAEPAAAEPAAAEPMAAEPAAAEPAASDETKETK